MDWHLPWSQLEIPRPRPDSPLRRLGLKRLLDSVGRYTQNPVRTQLCPGQSRVQVILPHMDAVRRELNRQIYVVVEKKGDLIAAAQGLNLQGLLLKCVQGQMLLPELDHGGPSSQGVLHLLCQGTAAQPGAVRDAIEQQVSLIEFHSGPPDPR